MKIVRLLLWYEIEVLYLMIIYRIVLEFSCEQSIGKKIMGLRIHSKHQLKFNEIVIRNFSRISLIYWLPIIAKKKGLHDRIAGTDVKKHLQHSIIWIHGGEMLEVINGGSYLRASPTITDCLAIEWKVCKPTANLVNCYLKHFTNLIATKPYTVRWLHYWNENNTWPK